MKCIPQMTTGDVHGSQPYRTTTLPLYGKGLSPELVYLSMGDLVSNNYGRTPCAATSEPGRFPLTWHPGWTELEAPEQGFRIPGAREGSYTRVSK
jgi:hypothetical protein